MDLPASYNNPRPCGCTAFADAEICWRGGKGLGSGTELGLNSSSTCGTCVEPGLSNNMWNQSLLVCEMRKTQLCLFVERRADNERSLEQADTVIVIVLRSRSILKHLRPKIQAVALALALSKTLGMP